MNKIDTATCLTTHCECPELRGLALETSSEVSVKRPNEVSIAIFANERDVNWNFGNERGINCEFWQRTRCQLQIIILRQGHDAANLGRLSLLEEERNAVRSD